MIKAEVWVICWSEAEADNTNLGLDNSSYYTKAKFNNCFNVYLKSFQKRILVVYHGGISRRLLNFISLISWWFWNLFLSVRFPRWASLFFGETIICAFMFFPPFTFLSWDASRMDNNDVVSCYNFFNIQQYYVKARLRWIYVIASGYDDLADGSKSIKQHDFS